MFNVGDEVRVIADPPSHGWGSVTPEEIGIITTILPKERISWDTEEIAEAYYVKFPRHMTWKGTLKDLELVTREPDWEV